MLMTRLRAAVTQPAHGIYFDTQNEVARHSFPRSIERKAFCAEHERVKVPLLPQTAAAPTARLPQPAVRNFNPVIT
jgi:hypothetical protein